MAEKHPLPTDSLGFTPYSNDQKRIKLDDHIISTPKNHMDPHNAPPSRVVHARAVPDGCTHAALVSSLARYGKIG